MVVKASKSRNKCIERQPLTKCGNGAVQGNVEILQSTRTKEKTITLNTIVKLYLVKEWVNTQDEKIRECPDVGLDAWIKLDICPERCQVVERIE